jgi:hypothetical protein
MKTGHDGDQPSGGTSDDRFGNFKDSNAPSE